MKINYWDCKYREYNEYWDGQEELRVYGCTHPGNPDHCCELDNKWGRIKADCVFLDLREQPISQPPDDNADHSRNDADDTD